MAEGGLSLLVMGESRSDWRSEGVQSHRDFVRRLARSLVRDEQRAEDLEQDTWLAALGSGVRGSGTRESGAPGPGLHTSGKPGGPSTFGRLGFAAQRAWLAVVARRRALADARGRDRRRDRELACAAPAGDTNGNTEDSPAELAERMELHQRLIDACLALPEPYRDALALRYFESLDPPRIAERLGIPLETVRTRLRRARAQVRSEFERRHSGEGGSVLSALGILAADAPSLATTTLATHAPLSIPWTGVFLMKTQITAGLLVFGCIAFFGWRALDADPRPGTTIAEVEGAGDSMDDPGLATNGDDADRVEASSPVGSDVGTAQGQAAEAPTTPRVRIEVRGSDGRWTSGHQGSFRVRAEGEAPLEDQRVEVTDGTFDVGEIGPYEIHELWLDDRAAFTVDPVQRGVEPISKEVSSGDLPVVRAEWIPDSTLRVVDARTDADLEGVVLLRGRPRYRDRVHPGTPNPEQLLFESIPSPIALPSIDGVQRYWAWAPDYAWGYIEFEHRGGGERVLALEPGASLDVRLVHNEADLAVFVRLYDPERDVLRRCNAEIEGGGAERVLFRGLPPGSYELSAEIGRWWDPPTPLAEATVEVPDRGIAIETLELDLEPLGDPPVPVRGRIDLPPGHPELDLTLEIRPFDRAALRKGDRAFIPRSEMDPVASVPGSLHFDAGVLTPGSYVAIVSSLQFGRRFEVEASPLDDLVIELPPVHPARVEILDSTTGAPVPVDIIAWSGSHAPMGMNMWGLENVRRHPDEDFFEFLATEGTISITLDHEGYGRGDGGMRIGPGLNHATLEIDPLPGIRITLLDGATRVPMRFPIQPRFVNAEGEDVHTWRERNPDDGSCIARAPGPGAYLLRIEGLEGYEPVPDQPVDLDDGDLQELEVRLVRRR